MRFRHLQSKDIRQVQKIAKDNLESTKWYSESTRRRLKKTVSEKNLREVLQKKHRICLICEDKEQVVGFIKGYDNFCVFNVELIYCKTQTKDLYKNLLSKIGQYAKTIGSHKIFAQAPLQDKFIQDIYLKSSFERLFVIHKHWQRLDYIFYQKFI